MATLKGSYSNIWILIIGLLGSLVRFAYGFFHEPWNLEADHIAWQIILKNGDWIYSDLIHYPHEGGSFLIGILAKLSQSFTSINSLAFVAFVLDFAVRCGQILIIKKVFGSKLFIVFGVFTIFAYPFIIPWGTVNFGLHSLSSIFPFLFLYLLHHWKDTPKFQVAFGVFAAAAIWFNYSNLVLLPVALFFVVKYKKTRNPLTFIILPFLLIMGLHLSTRFFTDPGFHLLSNSIFSIRGTQFETLSLITFKHLLLVGNTLANAASLSNSITNHMVLKVLFIISALIALVGSIRYWKSTPPNSSIKLAWGFVIAFLLIYGISPFFQSSSTTNYVLYRHLTYIFPLISMLLLHGIQNTKLPRIYAMLFIGTGVIGSILIIEPTGKKLVISPNQTAGWVIAAKYGDQPEKIISLLKNEINQDEIMAGVGWGTTTALFENTTPSDTHFLIRTNQFQQISKQYPKTWQASFNQGVFLAFSPEVTPILNPKIQEQLFNP